MKFELTINESENSHTSAYRKNEYRISYNRINGHKARFANPKKKILLESLGEKNCDASDTISI